jgi:hypothetical protein
MSNEANNWFAFARGNPSLSAVAFDGVEAGDVEEDELLVYERSQIRRF